MDVIVERLRDATLAIRLTGRLSACAESLRERVEALDLRNERRLTIDLAGVRSLAAGEIEQLGAIRRRALAAGCAFRVVHTTASLRTQLQAGGLADLIETDWDADDVVDTDPAPAWPHASSAGVCASRDVERAVIVEVTGEIDLATAPELRYAIEQAIRSHPPRVLVDLAGVTFFSSCGLTSLLGALRRARESNAELGLVAPSRSVRLILSITGVETVFTIHDSIEDAVALRDPSGPESRQPLRPLPSLGTSRPR